MVWILAGAGFFRLSVVLNLGTSLTFSLNLVVIASFLRQTYKNMQKYIHLDIIYILCLSLTFETYDTNMSVIQM